MNDPSVSYRVALGGIVSSLCLLCMFLAGVIPVFYLLLPMIAGALMMIIVIEVSTEWAFVTYIAVGLLSIFVTFDKQAALIFIFLFGHYPILKSIFEKKIKSKALCNIIKFIIYNICIIAYYYGVIYILGSKELMKNMQKFGIAVLIVAEFFFFTYDYSLTALIDYYKDKIKPKITGYNHRKQSKL